MYKSILKFSILIFAFFLLNLGNAEAATLRLSPAIGSFALGSTFDVSVVMNTQGIAVNTVEVELLFPADKLQIANPSLGKSIVQIWASPPTFSNREGRIYFVGGIPSPGVNTSEGVVQSFTFRVVAPAGEAKISFGKNSSVLANDGLGTNVLKQTSPAAFRLTLPPAQGPEVFSPTHPEQGKWYRDPNPIMKWSAAPNSEGFSYIIDHSPTTIPDTAIDTRNSEATFSNLESGIWYFHVRERAGGSWGGASHYFINVDTVQPAAFGINVSPDTRTSEKSPIFRFFTTDSLSGFDHFEMKVVSLKSGPTETTFFFEVASPHQLSGLTAGRYEVVIRAFDKAGNFRDESVTLTILSSAFSFITSEGIDFALFFVPWRMFLPAVIAIILIMVGILLILWHRHQHHLTHAFREDISRFLSFNRRI